MRRVSAISLFCTLAGLVLLADLILRPGDARPGAGSSVAHVAVPTTLDVSFDVVTTLGGGEDDRGEPLGLPRVVRTDAQGRIFVADALAMTIKVFGPDGTFRYAIGGRGRAPGRFQSIDTMHVTSTGEVVVADNVSQRLTRLTGDGQLRETVTLASERLPNPRHGFALGGGEHLFVFRPPTGPQHLFHRFGARLDTPLDAFGDVADFGPPGDPVVRALSRIDPGSVWIEDDDGITFAPLAYRGIIHRYRATDEGHRHHGRLRGWVHRDTPYARLDPASIQARRAHLRSTEQGVTLRARMHNESRGLVRLTSGETLHFSLQTTGNRRVFGLEVFDTEGRLLGYGPVRDVPAIDGLDANQPVRVAWRDDGDRLYVIDRSGVPAVRVVRLHWRPATTRTASITNLPRPRASRPSGG